MYYVLLRAAPPAQLGVRGRRARSLTDLTNDSKATVSVLYVTQRCDEFTRNTTLCYRFLTRRVEESGREEEEESEERGKGGREETLVETRPPPLPRH